MLITLKQITLPLWRAVSAPTCVVGLGGPAGGSGQARPGGGDGGHTVNIAPKVQKGGGATMMWYFQKYTFVRVFRRTKFQMASPMPPEKRTLGG